MANFTKGQRVLVQTAGREAWYGGSIAFGTVNYQRMKAPDYSEAEAVSVIMDTQKETPGYSGSIFAAEQVHPVKKFRARFFGRTRGAIGIGQSFDILVEAISAEAVNLSLYEGQGTLSRTPWGTPQAYDHISGLVVEEVSE